MGQAESRCHRGAAEQAAMSSGDQRRRRAVSALDVRGRTWRDRRGTPARGGEARRGRQSTVERAEQRRFAELTNRPQQSGENSAL